MGVHQPIGRCRLCGANDREQLIEDVARAVWESGAGRDDLPDDERLTAWGDAGPYWRSVFRRHATAMLGVVQAGR